MTEDPNSAEQQLIKDTTRTTRETLRERLLLFRRGLGEVQTSGGTRVRLYEETLSRGQTLDDANPFVIVVYRESERLKRREQDLWRFLPNGTVEKEGVIAEGRSVRRYGKGGLPVPPHNLSDAEILLALAIDPVANFDQIGDLTFLDSRARSSKTGSPKQNAR